MRVFLQATATSLAAIAALAVTNADDAPTVTIKNGSYYGLYDSSYSQDQFLGMPFAQPPVGDLRFVNPQPLNTTWTEAKNATEYSLECYGYGSDQWVLGNIVSEDCLTLNVVRPSGISEGDSLPVGVWIHGGGFSQGGSRDPRYNLTYIVDQSVQMGKPFIGVSINYRLHGFGFLWGSEIAAAGAGNLGLKDQRLALHWVNENIEFFGGDKDKVTIFGESAGGFSVAHQLVAYGGRDDGLIRGAIMESGYMSTSTVNATAWDVYYNNITAAAGCDTAADTLACLRQVPVETLSDIFNSTSASFSPITDGEFLEDLTVNLLDNGKFNHVPFLMGQNHDEGSAFGTAGIDTDEEFLAYLVATGRSEEQAKILGEVYPDIPEIGIPGTLHGRPSADSGYGLQFKRVAAYAGDSYFHGFRRYMAQTWAANNVTSYSYNFNVLVNGLSQFIGSTHFQEVAFVFHNIEGNGYNTSVAVGPFLGKPESYVRLATLMSRMWVSFIVDQTPNHSGVTHLEWPEYTTEDAQIIVFDANVTELAYTAPDTYRAEGIAYLHDLYHSS